MPKGIVEYIVKSLVKKPDQVKIVDRPVSGEVAFGGRESAKILLEIHVDKDDLGKVIGRAGKTIRSIRAIVGLVFPDKDLLIDVAK